MLSDRYLYKAKQKNWRELPEEEQWVYGYYVRGFNEYEEPMYIIFDPTTIYSSNGKTDGWDEIDPTTLCACTGLKDKNDKLIWENDIVKCQDVIGKIGWNETHLAFTILVVEESVRYYYIDESLSDDIGVIGNIFDNLELMEV